MSAHLDIAAKHRDRLAQALGASRRDCGGDDARDHA